MSMSTDKADKKTDLTNAPSYRDALLADTDYTKRFDRSDEAIKQALQYLGSGEGPVFVRLGKTEDILAHGAQLLLAEFHYPDATPEVELNFSWRGKRQVVITWK